MDRRKLPKRTAKNRLRWIAAWVIVSPMLIPVALGYCFAFALVPVMAFALFLKGFCETSLEILHEPMAYCAGKAAECARKILWKYADYENDSKEKETGQ